MLPKKSQNKATSRFINNHLNSVICRIFESSFIRSKSIRELNFLRIMFDISLSFSAMSFHFSEMINAYDKACINNFAYNYFFFKLFSKHVIIFSTVLVFILQEMCILEK